MEQFCFDELAGIGVGRRVTVPSSRWGRRRSSSSTSSSNSLWLEPGNTGQRLVGTLWESSVHERGDLRSDLVLETPCGPTRHAQENDSTAAAPGSWSDLPSLDRYRRDDQRHERLAVSLTIGYTRHRSCSSADHQPILRTESPSPEPSPVAPPPAQDFLNNPYCESLYDPYDQPEGYEPVDQFSFMSKPGPEVNLTEFGEKMKNFFSPQQCETPPAGEMQATAAQAQRSHEPSPPRKDQTTSAQAALVKLAAASKLPMAASTYEIPKAKRIRPHTDSPLAYPTLEAETEAATEDFQDKDESLRAFSELAHKRLVSPAASSSSADYPEKRAVVTALIEPREDLPSPEQAEEEDDAMLSEYWCRIDGSRNARNRTMRRTCVRKRKREEDHAAGRSNPAAPPTGPGGVSLVL